MKILNLFVLFCLAGFTLAAGTEEYRITGTVTKRDGGPLAGVTVLLKGKNVSVITGANGAFEIVPTFTIQMKAPQSQTLSFSLSGNAVRFSPVEGTVSGTVSIFSGNGKRIASIDFPNLNPTTDQITLPQLASGMNFIRVFQSRYRIL